jgi:hypothetical protein
MLLSLFEVEPKGAIRNGTGDSRGGVPDRGTGLGGESHRPNLGAGALSGSAIGLARQGREGIYPAPDKSPSQSGARPLLAEIVPKH